MTAAHKLAKLKLFGNENSIVNIVRMVNFQIPERDFHVLHGEYHFLVRKFDVNLVVC